MLTNRSLCVLLASAWFMLAPPSARATDEVDPALCRNLVAATPDADVAYQPGVDVHGHAVAPADLNGTAQSAIGKNIDIPLTVNLAQSLGLNVTRYPYNQFGAGTEGIIGVLSLRGNKTYFNGQPLSDPEQDRLAVLCMQPH